MLGELTSDEIDELLRTEAIGRIGCYAFGQPYVVPVTYAYDGDSVYGHSREGLKLRDTWVSRLVRSVPWSPTS